MLVGEVICFKYADEPQTECYKLEVTDRELAIKS
jgi:hypothetical protein